MFKRRFRLPSPALVISMVALSLVLGGTAVAASTAKHSDKKADTKLIKQLAPTLSVKHATTADSATNATNATNATSAANAANASQLGGVAATGYQRSTLPPGKTETGVFSAWGQASSAGGYLADGVTYPVPLAADLTTGNWVFLPENTTSATHCPGIGQADPGYLCFYEEGTGNTALINVFDPTTGNDGLSKIGFDMYYGYDAAGPGWSYGEWAVTAPTTALKRTAAREPSGHPNP